MSAIHTKSLTGITSITTPPGVDNVFTVHSNDTTERFRVDLNGNQRIAGILTVAQDLDVDGHAELDNLNVSGIGTFNGIRLIDNKSILLGSSDDMRIRHTGSHSQITDEGTGSLRLGGNQVVIGKSDFSETSAVFTQGAGATLKYANNTKFATTNTGVSITGNNVVSGNVTAVDGTFSGNVSIGGTLTYEDVTNIDSIGIITAKSGIHLEDYIFHKGNTSTSIGFPAVHTIFAKTNGNERLRITPEGLVGIGQEYPKAGFSIRTLGDYSTNDGNTYWIPEGQWSTVWNHANDILANRDYWVGFAGGYHKSGQSVNISLAPNRGNHNAQQGMYISGEATAASSSDFAIGKIIGGNQLGISTLASTGKRATKSELFRIKNTGKVGIGTINPDELLHIFSASSHSKIVLESDNNSALNGIYWVDEGDNTQSEFYYSHPDNKQFLRLNGNGLEVYSKQTSSTIAKVGHGIGYNEVVIPNGKVGVGTDDPSRTLDVQGSSNLDILKVTNHATSFSNDFYTLRVDSSAHSSNMTSAGAFAVEVNSAVGGHNGRAFTINGMGNIGIGTNSPGGVTDIQTTSGTYEPLRIRRTGSGGGDSDWSVKPYAGNLYFRTGTNRDDMIAFSSSGQIVTSDGSSSGLEAGTNTKLCVVGTGSPGVHPSTISASTLATFRMTGGLGHAAAVSILGGNTGSSALNFGDRDNELIGRIIYNHTSSNTDDYMAFYVQGDEKLRITSAGDIAIGRDDALANYADGSTTTTQLAVVKDGGAAGSGYHEVAHFTGGSDSNDTGAIVRITQFNNDRGMFIKAGRGTSDQAKAIIGLRNSAANEGNWITLTQNSDQITCHKSVDIDNGVNLSLGGTSGTHAPLHVKSENTSYGKNAVFGASGWVNNANYHYADATISLLGRDLDGNDKGVGIEFTARNTGNSNWLHGALTMARDGAFRIYAGGAGTSNGPERFILDASGNAKLGSSTPAAFTGGAPNHSQRFLGKKCMQGSVTDTTTLNSSGAGTFDLGRLWITDDTSIELFIQVCRNDSANYTTHYAKAFIQKVRGSGMSNGHILYQNGAASGFTISGISAGGYTASGGSSHGTQITVTGGAGDVIYRMTCFYTSISKNDMF